MEAVRTFGSNGVNKKGCRSGDNTLMVSGPYCPLGRSAACSTKSISTQSNANDRRWVSGHSHALCKLAMFGWERLRVRAMEERSVLGIPDGKELPRRMSPRRGDEGSGLSVALWAKI